MLRALLYQIREFFFATLVSWGGPGDRLPAGSPLIVNRATDVAGPPASHRPMKTNEQLRLLSLTASDIAAETVRRLAAKGYDWTNVL